MDVTSLVLIIVIFMLCLYTEYKFESNKSEVRSLKRKVKYLMDKQEQNEQV